MIDSKKDKQVRIDFETYAKIVEYAKNNGYSIKEAVKKLVGKGA